MYLWSSSGIFVMHNEWYWTAVDHVSSRKNPGSFSLWTNQKCCQISTGEGSMSRGCGKFYQQIAQSRPYTSCKFATRFKCWNRFCCSKRFEEIEIYHSSSRNQEIQTRSKKDASWSYPKKFWEVTIRVPINTTSHRYLHHKFWQFLMKCWWSILKN